MHYHKGSCNGKADALSRCLEFTSREAVTTAPGNQMLCKRESWVEIGEILINDEEFEVINIGALEVEFLLPEAKERIMKKLNKTTIIRRFVNK